MSKFSLFFLLALSSAHADTAEYFFRNAFPIAVSQRSLAEWNGGQSFIAFQNGRQGQTYDYPAIPLTEPNDFQTVNEPEYCIIGVDTAAFSYQSSHKSGLYYDAVQAFSIPASTFAIHIDERSFGGKDGEGIFRVNFVVENKINAEPIFKSSKNRDTDREPLVQLVTCQVRIHKNSTETESETMQRMLTSSFGGFFTMSNKLNGRNDCALERKISAQATEQ